MAEDPGNGIVGQLSNAFHSFISGDSFKQGLKDAWNRHFSSAQPQTDHDKAVAEINAQTNAHANDAANASFAAAQAKMKGESHTYDSNRPQVQVRSRYSK